MKVTDDTRHNAIVGIMKGADKYLTGLIQRQEKSLRDLQTDQQSESLNKLISLRKHINSIERTYVYKPSQPTTMRGMKPSTISLLNHSETDKSVKAQIQKSDLSGMLEKTETQLVGQITQTHCYYKLIG